MTILLRRRTSALLVALACSIAILGAAVSFSRPARAVEADTSPPYMKYAIRMKRAFDPKTGWNMWPIKLNARDAGRPTPGDGLDKVQFWFSVFNRPTFPKAGILPGFVSAFGWEVGVPGKYPPVWVRVSDKAGNWSDWYRIR